MSIPQQRTSPEPCICGAPLHWTNRQLGPVLVHANGSEYCGEAGQPATQRAVSVAAEVRR